MLYPGSPFCNTTILSIEYFLENIEHDVVSTISDAVNILGTVILGIGIQENKQHDGPLGNRFSTTGVLILTFHREKSA